MSARAAPTGAKNGAERAALGPGPTRTQPADGPIDDHQSPITASEPIHAK
jgi:hypothetical protein